MSKSNGNKTKMVEDKEMANIKMMILLVRLAKAVETMIAGLDQVGPALDDGTAQELIRNIDYCQEQMVRLLEIKTFLLEVGDKPEVDTHED